MRLALRIVAGLLLLLVALPLAGFALLQTGPGKAWLGRQLGAEGITGLVPFDMRVAELRYEDWLVARNLHFAIAPADLLVRQLTIRELSAETVDVLRLPASEGGGGSGGFSLPLDVALHSARVRTLHLAEPVLGEPLTVALGARAFLGRGRIEGHLAIDRTDGQPGRILLDAAFRDERLKLAGVADEPSGVLLRRLAGQAAPLRLELGGDGPVEDWRGELQASAGALAELRAKIGLAESVLTVEGEASAPGFLPPFLQGFAFDAVAALDAKELRRLRINADAGTLTAHGAYGEATRIEARLDVPDVAAFAPLSGPASATAVAELHGERLVVPRFEATHGSASLAGSAERIGEDLHGEARLAVADLSQYGDLSGAAQLDATFKTVPGAIVAALDGSVARFGAAGASVGSGTLGGELRYANGTATASLDAALADLAAATATARAGRLRLTAEQLSDGSARAALEGRVEGVLTGSEAGDALIGSEAIFAARARRDDGRLHIESATLDGAALRASAEGIFADALDARFAVELPRLGTLAEGVGGHASITGTARGPLDAVTVSARLDAREVTHGERRLDRLVADVTGSATGARFDAVFDAASLKGTIVGEVARRGDAIEAKGVRLEAAGSTVAADLAYTAQTGSTTGRLTARIPDLAPWSKLAAMDLAGRLSLDASLAGSDLDLAVDGAGIAAAGMRIGKLAGKARLRDVLEAPLGDGELSLANMRLRGGEVSSLRVAARAQTPGEIGFEGDLGGKFQEEVQLAFAGRLDLAHTGEALHVARLDGSFGGDRVALRKPFAATRRGKDFSLSGLDVTLGTGRLAGSASLTGNAIEAAFSARRLPVALLARLAGEKASGELGLELSLSGTLAKPEGRLVIEGTGLHTRPQVPPFGVVAEATWRRQRVDLRGRFDGLRGAALGFSGFLPLRLDPSTLAVEIPENEPVSFHAEGDGELGSFADLLPIGEDRLSGRFRIDAIVRGTLAAPQAAGVLAFESGRYESLELGTLVTDVNAELAGDNDRFVLRRFSARDGRRGELAAEGGVLLSATPGPVFDVAATLTRFRLLRRDDMTATASGTARVSGTIIEPHVAARLRVDEAELRVPERAPASAPTLDVIEIDSRTGERLTPEAASSAEPRLPVALDIDVEIPGRTFVRGRGLDSQWQGRLSVRGTTAAPELVGRLEVVSGSFDLLGRRFTLGHGEIAFDGGDRIDPRLDVVAQAETAGITAEAVLGGTASAPTLRLSSTPELPQDEILARVLFSREAGQLTAAQGLQLAQAAAALAGGGPGVFDRLRGTFGLDRLDVGAGNDTQSSPTLSAGKYVSDGVFVGVDQSLSGESRARVEVEVLPNITVETEVGSRGAGAGIGLNWRMDY
jgi:translocation and assembly module TamB